MILRLLGIQGMAGLIVSLCLGALLALQKGETRHWKKQSGQYEQLYRGEQAAFAGTVANYRAAAEAARRADKAVAERVQAERSAINERIAHDFEARLADARARARGLQLQTRTAAADPRSRRAAPVPGLPGSPGRTPQAPDQDGLSQTDALTATEQAIQLDELIKWVKAQAKVDNNGNGVASPASTKR